MQQQSQPRPGKRSPDYITIVAQARANVAGFDKLYKDLERSISVSGKSASTLTNYGRRLAHLALTGKSRDECPNGAGACVLKTGELASSSIRLKNLPITGSV
jgi:hypothetical protein